MTADGLVNQINNPEVDVDVARPDVKTRRLIMELRVAVNRLRLAQTGRDADFMDSEYLCELAVAQHDRQMLALRTLSERE